MTLLYSSQELNFTLAKNITFKCLKHININHILFSYVNEHLLLSIEIKITLLSIKTILKHLFMQLGIYSDFLIFVCQSKTKHIYSDIV